VTIVIIELVLLGRKMSLIRGPSLDDLVRPQQQRLRDRQAEGLGGLEVDDQLELGRLLVQPSTACWISVADAVKPGSLHTAPAPAVVQAMQQAQLGCAGRELEEAQGGAERGEAAVSHGTIDC
jgi:hypothetical protein